MGAYNPKEDWIMSRPFTGPELDRERQAMAILKHMVEHDPGLLEFTKENITFTFAIFNALQAADPFPPELTWAWHYDWLALFDDEKF